MYCKINQSLIDRKGIQETTKCILINQFSKFSLRLAILDNVKETIRIKMTWDIWGKGVRKTSRDRIRRNAQISKDLGQKQLTNKYDWKKGGTVDGMGEERKLKQIVVTRGEENEEEKDLGFRVGKLHGKKRKVCKKWRE